MCIKSGAEMVIDEAMLSIDENYGANLPVGMFDPDNFEPTRVCLFNQHLIVWQPGLLFDNIRVAMIRPGQILFKMVHLTRNETINHMSDVFVQNVHIRAVDDYIGLA